MNIEWMMEPVTQVSVLGVGIAGSLALWLSAKSDARTSKKNLVEFRVSTEATIQALAARIDEMGSAPAPVIEPLPSVSAAGVQGLNLTTRAKALRMYHRGEAIPSIAATLGVQQEEVSLLLKVDRLLDLPIA